MGAPTLAVEESDERERGSPVAVAGIAFAALFTVAWVLLQGSPGLASSSQELVDFYADPDRRRGSLIAGLYLIPFAGIAFIWFMAAVRARHLQRGGPENVLLSTVQLLTGTLFVAALFLIAAVRLALVLLAQAVSEGELDPDAVRAMMALAVAMAEIVGLRAAAVFVAVSSTRARRAGLFPRWYGIVSLLIVLALLFTFNAWRPVALLVPAWVFGTSIFVLIRRHVVDVPVTR
jgi:cytochrome bd-type quinol oxidase subunit 2